MDRAIDELERWVAAFVQRNLVIDRIVRRSKINAAPLDVKDAVGGCACGLSKDAATALCEVLAARVARRRIISALVGPERRQHIGGTRNAKRRRARDVRTIDIWRSKAGVAIGDYIDSVKSLIVQLDWEWQWEGRNAIVAVNADVIGGLYESGRGWGGRKCVTGASAHDAIDATNPENLVGTGRSRYAGNLARPRSADAPGAAGVLAGSGVAGLHDAICPAPAPLQHVGLHLEPVPAGSEHG